MCFPINSSEAASAVFFLDQEDDCVWFPEMPGTARLIRELTQYRNEDGSDFVGVFCKRVIAGVGYPLLALVALVEGVVRLAMTGIALLPAAAFACCDEGGALGAVAWSGLLTSILTPELIVRCAVGFVKNVYRKAIRWRDLTLCNDSPNRATR